VIIPIFSSVYSGTACEKNCFKKEYTLTASKTSKAAGLYFDAVRTLREMALREMELWIHALLLTLISAIVVAGAVFFIYLDAVGRLEIAKETFPSLQKWATKRNSVAYLLLLAIILEVGLLGELMLRDLPGRR